MQTMLARDRSKEGKTKVHCWPGQIQALLQRLNNLLTIQLDIAAFLRELALERAQYSLAIPVRQSQTLRTRSARVLVIPWKKQIASSTKARPES
jgi:hypothetical protein